MHNAILNGGLGHTFQGGFISIVRDANGGNAAIAQRELCEEISTIHLGTDIASSFTVADGMMGSDDLHYSQKGNNAIGAALGDSVGNYVAGPLRSTAGDAVMILYAIPAIVLSAIILMVIRSKLTTT